MILAGDIGGTNTRLALCERTEKGFRITDEDKFPSSAFSGLKDIVEEFLDVRSGKIDHACFGVPGPVTGETVKLANLPWEVDVQQIRELIGGGEVCLLNDLEANAYGLDELEETDFAVLNSGDPNCRGNAAIMSAGTGLGEAGMHFEEEMRILRPFASEGGHADFAPRTDLEIELLQFLRAKFGRVSVERVVSGKGLQNIYEFLRDAKGEVEPGWLAEEIEVSGDAAAVISKNALNGTSSLCEKTLDIFVAIYGAEAANLALKMLATGGIFLGGGIVPKILSKLQEPVFLESFFDKGRMRELLEKVPVRVVLNDKAALLGAAHFAFYKSETKE